MDVQNGNDDTVQSPPPTDTTGTAKKKAAKSPQHKKKLAAVRANRNQVPLQGVVGLKRPHRFKPGTVARREVHMYQMGSKATEDLMQKAPLERLIRDILYDLKAEGRLQGKAVEAIYASTQDLMVDLLEESGTLATMNKKKTIQQQHFRKAAYTLLPKLIIPPPVRLIKVPRGSGAKARFGK